MTATIDADELIATLRGRGADRTATEIAQQPVLWREVADDLATWRADHPALEQFLGREDVRIVLTGAGTSAYAGEVVAPAIRRTRRRRVDTVPTTTLVADPRATFAEDVPTVLVSFARSGDSPESVAATELADALLTDVHHLIITCNPDGRLAREHADRAQSSVLLMPAAANDRGFAMTSSFTCMALATYLLLSTTDDEHAGRLTDDLAAFVERSFATRTQQAAALARAGHRRVVYLGSGPFEGLARESALKLMELTAGHVVAIGESAMGFRHGPKAFLDDDTLAVVYVSADPYTRGYDLDIADELRAALPAGQVVVVGAQPERFVELADGTNAVIWPLPDTDDVLRALAAVIGAQLLALQTSLALGFRSDNPFPDGEVNRVVQGVTVHPLPAEDGTA